MKRTFKLALGAVMTAALVVPAMAQDNFPDTPANHWAYEALARLKRDGLLVGYPDGLFRGSRPASRYELAVAIHAAYTNLRNAVEGLETQIKNIPTSNNADDIKNLKDALTALQSQVSGMSAYGKDISNLKKGAETFDKELKSLGVDVDALKKGLSDLGDRVTVLEKKKPAVDISGDINLLMLAGNSRDDRAGLTKDGGLTGLSSDGGPVGLTRDLTILHEAAFNLTGTAETGPKWNATIVTSNMLGAFGTMSTLPGGLSTEGKTDIYVEDLSVKFGTSVLGLGFNVNAGRIGYKVSPYIFQRPDTTEYYANDRWDNGEYRFDGATLGFKFGAANLDVFGGRNSKRLTSQGVEINPILIANNRIPGTTLETAGMSQIDRSLGLNLNVPILTNGNLNLSYLWLDSDATNLTSDGVGLGNRVAIFGGTADFSFGKIKVDGGYSKSNVQYNSSNVTNSDNSAWNANATYTGEKFKLNGGYREVEANYVAPGDWGRLGILRNPANIKGFQVGGSLNLKPGLILEAKGEFDKGKSNIGSIFNTDSKIDSYTVKLGYNLTENLNATLSYEDTKFKSLPSETAEPHFKWYSLGIGYGLSANAKLSLAYEISDHENINVGPFADFGGKYTGGLLTTQLTVKF